jgi:hypothetical protein
MPPLLILVGRFPAGAERIISLSFELEWHESNARQVSRKKSRNPLAAKSAKILAKNAKN